MIIMFIGPSGSGKDYYYKEAMKQFDLNKITLLTTRPQREGEVNGREYFFVDDNYIKNLEENNSIVEKRSYNTVHGIWTYATSAELIEEDKDYLVINTWEGYEKYIEYFGKDKVIPMYFQVNDEERLRRALEREKKEKEPKLQEVKRRFLADKKDFSVEMLKKYNPIIIDNNKTVDYTIFQVSHEINKILYEKNDYKQK